MNTFSAMEHHLMQKEKAMEQKTKEQRYMRMTENIYKEQKIEMEGKRIEREKQ